MSELRHGNCHDLLRDSGRMQSVPLVVTDPPYLTAARPNLCLAGLVVTITGQPVPARPLSTVTGSACWCRSCAVTRACTSSVTARVDPLYYAYLYEHVKSLRLLVWDRGTAQNGYTWRYQCQDILFAPMPDAPADRRPATGDLLRHRPVPVC